MKSRLAILTVSTVLLLSATATPALADNYVFRVTNLAHSSHWEDGDADPNGTYPYPVRWWAPAGYNTNSTWYKLGTLDDSFKSAIRSGADTDWDVGVWEFGSQYFHFWEDQNPIVDSTNRTLGMTHLASGVLGQTWFTVQTTWHPVEVTRLGTTGHAAKKWYIRFQNTNADMPDGMVWGNTNSPGIADRESVATHELGHAISLGHPDQVDSSDWQTMLTLYQGGTGEFGKTGTWMRNVARFDEWGVERLYPNY